MPHRQGRLLRTALAAGLSIAAFCGCNPAHFDALVRDGGGAGKVAKDYGEAPGGSDAAADAGDDAATHDGGSDAGCRVADRPDGVVTTANELGILPAPGFAPKRILVGSAAIGNRLAVLFSLPDDPTAMVVWTTKDELLSDMRFNDDPPVVSLLPPGAAAPGIPASLTGVVAPNDSELLIFFSTFDFLTPNAVGVARLRRNRLQAELVHPVDQFFPPPPPNVKWHPVFSGPPLVETTNAGSFLYLYACGANPAAPDETAPGYLVPCCRVARAPADMATAGDSWRYWNGSDWDDQPLRAVPVIRGGGVSSMSYNRYLRAFLGVRSGLSNNVVLIWAPRPEGPWQTLKEFPTLPGVGEVNMPLDISLYAAEHLALRDACEQDIYLTYGRQILVSNGAGGTMRQNETRLLRVSFE